MYFLFYHIFYKSTVENCMPQGVYYILCMQSGLRHLQNGQAHYAVFINRMAGLSINMIYGVILWQEKLTQAETKF